MSDISQERKVFFGLHLYRMPDRLHQKPFLASFKGTVELLESKGYTTQKGFAWGDPYIQRARNHLVNQFLESDCGVFFFIADDIEFDPHDALRLIETEGDVVAGAYPIMGGNPIKFPVDVNKGPHGIPLTRDSDGAISAKRVQTGFLRIRRKVFEDFIAGYPELAFYGVHKGRPYSIRHDFFPQGVHNHRWLGEDYSFCDFWIRLGGEIWIVPDIDLTHHSEKKAYFGNYHEYLMRLPGGKNESKAGDGIYDMRPGPHYSLKPLLKEVKGENLVMVEIGSYTGQSTVEFAKSGKFSRIYAVDTWENGYFNDPPLWHGSMEEAEKLFDGRMFEFNNCFKVKQSSVNAAKTFENSSLDFVYIDVDHTYKSVKADIQAWLPKIKSGGIIAGHDYDLAQGVNKAVNELLGKPETFPDYSWLMRIT